MDFYSKNMAKEQYGIITAKKPEFPQRALLRVPNREDKLFVAYPAFGPDAYEGNLKTMSRNYSYPKTKKIISFREPTTSESISAAAYDFENIAKPQIFDSKELQVWRIVKTSEGVFANPPKDAQGNPIIDEQILKSYLNKSMEVNGIWLYNGEDARDFGFAPYETFTEGKQDCDDFCKDGLARVLEHTSEKQAKNLREIVSSKNYPHGVDIWGFDEVKKPFLRVVDLNSGFGSKRLLVCSSSGKGGGSYAFGVLNEEKKYEATSTLSRRLILEKS